MLIINNVNNVAIINHCKSSQGLCTSREDLNYFENIPRNWLQIKPKAKFTFKDVIFISQSFLFHSNSYFTVIFISQSFFISLFISSSLVNTYIKNAPPPSTAYWIDCPHLLPPFIAPH